jgi:hypothetical protein
MPHAGDNRPGNCGWRDARPGARTPRYRAVTGGPALAVPPTMLESALAFTIVIGTILNLLTTDRAK